MNPLAKKLLIKPGTSWLFYNAPQTYINLLEPLPEGVKATFEATGKVDGLQFFISSMADLAKGLTVIKAVAKPDSIIWVSYPKKSSGVKTDLNLDMMNNWPELTEAGLEVVASISVDDVWSGLRLKAIGQARQANADIQQNDYSAYIDVEKKLITLPPDVQEALQAEPAAFNIYEKLAYSHRKEYIIWILSARQQKTRDARLVKMVEMLLNGSKNPGDK